MPEETSKKLRELAQNWAQANHSDAMGMGSATPGSIRAVTHARQEFEKALLEASARPSQVADALLYEPADWCIWSVSHKAWWRGGSHGYTTRALEAGRYERAEVLWILNSSTPGDNIPVHETRAKDDIWPGVTGR
jgi:hypothetical protein